MGAVKEVSVNIGGRRYLIASDDDYLKQLRRGFEPEMVKLFGVLVNNDDVVLDVGANIGCTAILFGAIAQVVYAFEPSQTTYAFLEKNVLQSGLQNIILQNIGLGAEAGESTLTFTPSNRSGGFVSNQVSPIAGHAVEKIVIRQLDDFVQSLSLLTVNFIKIDVEGFEPNVLLGAKQTLQAFKPVVVLELNHWCLNAFQRMSIPDFFDRLRSLFPILLAVDGSGYLSLHDDNERYLVMYHHILHGRFPNIVAAFDETRLYGFRSSYAHGFVTRSHYTKIRDAIKSMFNP